MLKLFLTFLLLVISTESMAISIIEDDEIETAIQKISSPLIKAADLSKRSIRIYLINDSEINAFVSDNNLFINTGLLMHFHNPTTVAGVIAHELGHIKASHTMRKMKNIQDQGQTMVLGTILSIASLALGNPGLAIGIAAGAQDLSAKSFFSYSKQYENEADQIAMQLLEKANLNPRGLMEVLTSFSEREQGLTLNPYYRTHPVSKERINLIKHHLNAFAQYSTFNSKLLVLYKRAMIKLEAFLDKPTTILAKFRDDSTDSIYARSIAYYKQGKISAALDLVNIIIGRESNNPYFTEFKAQLLIGQGKVNQALTEYSRAQKLRPQSHFISLSLANCYIWAADKSPEQKNHYLHSAIKILQDLLDRQNMEKDLVYHYLSIAYGKLQDYGKTYYFMAEKFHQQRNKPEMLRYANKALKLLNKDSVEYIQCQDILYSYQKP